MMLSILGVCPPSRYLWLRAVATHGKTSPPVVINIKSKYNFIYIR